MSRYRFDASKVTHPEGRWLIASAAVLAIAIALGVVLSRLDLAVLNGWPIAVVAVGTGGVVAVLLYGAGSERRRRCARAEELRHAVQTNTDKDRFIAAVSHELRTPLTSVVGLADELKDRIDAFDRDQVVDLIALLAQESHEMALIVEDLLVAARAEDGTVVIRPEALDIDEQIVAVCAGLGDLDTTISILPSNATVWADPLRFRQIIRNLIMNAVRHGGPFVEIAVHHDQTITAVEIRDDGLGLHGDHRSRVFGPYYRSAVVRGQAPSTGLGLSVAHSLARSMDGTVTYRFDEGWSVFRVELPAVMVATSNAHGAA